MKKLNFEEMKKLYDKATITIFNDKYNSYDSVDRTGLYDILYKKTTRDFYFTSALKFIELYLTEIMKK